MEKKRISIMKAHEKKLKNLSKNFKLSIIRHQKSFT